AFISRKTPIRPGAPCRARTGMWNTPNSGRACSGSSTSSPRRTRSGTSRSGGPTAARSAASSCSATSVWSPGCARRSTAERRRTGRRGRGQVTVWEYHHDVGKSCTGGTVYRGPRLPELDGLYLYADYVTTKIWALGYDFDKKRVVANRPIRDPNVPVFSFGE